jgi:integrase
VRFLHDDEEVRLREALTERDCDMRAKRAQMNRWLAARGQPLLPDYPEHFVDHLEPIVLTLFGTGLRFGELTHMRWSAVDLRSRMLTVDGDNAKTGRTRYVPMPAEIMSIMSRWRSRHHVALQDFAFPGKHGRPLVDIKTAWAALLRRARVENFRIHDLRHSYASRLVQRGVNLFLVQQLLGHTSPIMTQRYAHLGPNHLADAVAVLDEPRWQQPARAAAKARGRQPVIDAGAVRKLVTEGVGATEMRDGSASAGLVFIDWEQMHEHRSPHYGRPGAANVACRISRLGQQQHRAV